MSEKKFYVYEHWRPDRGECFYVGKGHGRRANDMSLRNRWHKFIQAKLSALGTSVEVKIVFDGLTQDEAFAKEIERIAFWRNDGADLVNMTIGGDGSRGVKVTEETRRKISERSKGRKPSQQTRAKMSKAAIGNKRAAGAVRSPEYLAALSERTLGRTATPETKLKQRLRKLGTKLSDEHKAKIKAAVTLAYENDEIRQKCFPSAETIEKGRLANIGKKQTPEHIAKKTNAIKGRKNSEVTRKLMSESRFRYLAEKKSKILSTDQE